MNRIVREHYPVSRLPEDLREGLGSDEDARVTVETSTPFEPTPDLPSESHLSRFAQVRRANFASMDEIVAHLRAHRDEWTERE